MRFTPRKRKDIEITDDERLLHWSYYEVEAESKEEAEAKAEEKIAEGNVCWGDFEITDSTAEEVRKEKVRDVGDR